VSETTCPPKAPHERPLPLPDVLRDWVGSAASVSVDAAERRPFTHTPEALTRLVVRVEEDGRREVLVVGPRTRASYHPGRRLRSCVQLRLAPGTARPLLGVPAVDLVGRVVPLGELPSVTAHPLARELAAGEPEEAVAQLAGVVPDRRAVGEVRTELIRAGVRALSVQMGRVPGQVRDVARELAVSERQLRNLFAEGVGLSLKHYARIDRVRAVLDHAATVPWAELAAATGYYDQSHMTSDFRTLMGVPPRSFFAGRLPGVQPCQSMRRG
jgi:AraC-like DNA-binding protein